MPLDNVGSQMDLYNTKYTASHLNIYTHQYLKVCVFFYLSYSLKRTERMHNSWIPEKMEDKSSLISKGIHFTLSLPNSLLPTSQGHTCLVTSLSCCLRQLGQFCRATLCPFLKTTLIMKVTCSVSCPKDFSI